MGTLATLALGNEVKMLRKASCFPHTPESRRLEPIPHTCTSCEKQRSGVAIQGSLLLVVLFALFLAFPSSASAKMDRSDSSYVSTLNMTDEQKEKVYGVDSATLAKGPTLQELNEENPTYVKRTGRKKHFLHLDLLGINPGLNTRLNVSKIILIFFLLHIMPPII